MVRPFMFAALCQRAHPLKHSLAESEQQRKKIFVSRKIRQQGHSLAEVSLYIYMPTELIESNPYSLSIISVHTVRTDGVQHQHSIWQTVDSLPSSDDMTAYSRMSIIDDSVNRNALIFRKAKSRSNKFIKSHSSICSPSWSVT